MKCRIAKVCVCSTAMLVAPWVGAQEQLGSSGGLAIGAERLFGIVNSSTTSDENVGGVEASSTVSLTSISLLRSGGTSSFSTPRIGIDYFVIDHLSVGAALGFSTISASAEAESMGTSAEVDLGSGNSFAIAPRVGYAYLFNDTVGIWPRAGITYGATSFESDDGSAELSTNALAISAEVPLLIVPVPHVAFTIAPTLDLGVSGSTTLEAADAETSDVDTTTTDLGLQAGLLVYF